MTPPPDPLFDGQLFWGHAIMVTLTPR